MHSVISIAYTLAIKRNSVHFIKFNKMINILKNAYNEGAFDKKMGVRMFFWTKSDNNLT